MQSEAAPPDCAGAYPGYQDVLTRNAYVYLQVTTS